MKQHCLQCLFEGSCSYICGYIDKVHVCENSEIHRELRITSIDIVACQKAFFVYTKQQDGLLIGDVTLLISAPTLRILMYKLSELNMSVEEFKQEKLTNYVYKEAESYLKHGRGSYIHIL